MALPGVKQQIQGQKQGIKPPQRPTPTLSERVTLYILYADVLTRIQKDSPQATQVGITS